MLALPFAVGVARVFGVRSIDSIAGDYVERATALDPALATFAGIAGHDHELSDLSADGFAERAGLGRGSGPIFVIVSLLAGSWRHDH
jgi:hypothetical protein